MITFQQFCECLTCHQRYIYIILEEEYWKDITEEERKLVKVDEARVKNEGYVNLIYPTEKFYNRVRSDKEYNRLIRIALEKEDFVEITKLKKGRIKI